MACAAHSAKSRGPWLDRTLLGGCLAGVLGPLVATWVTLAGSGQAERLWMEQRRAERLEFPSLQELISGRYQKAFEAALGDQVARRQGVTRSYRRLQQIVARLAYATQGFEGVRPMDGRGLWQSETHLFEYSKRFQFEEGKGLADARKLREVAERFPSLRFHVHLVYDSHQLDCLGSLARLPASAARYAEEFQAGLGGRIPYSETRPGSLAEYCAAFYRTDHHWLPAAAWSAYESMVASLRVGPSLPRIALTRVPGAVFRGTYSRFAAWPPGFEDSLFFYRLGLRFQSITVEGKPGYRSHLDRPGAEGLPGPEVDSYQTLFGADAGEVGYRRDATTGGRRLLLVGDSMKQTAERWLASHFEETRVVDLRHWARVAGRPFDYAEFVKANRITDVIWLGEPGSPGVFGRP